MNEKIKCDQCQGEFNPNEIKHYNIYKKGKVDDSLDLCATCKKALSTNPDLVFEEIGGEDESSQQLDMIHHFWLVKNYIKDKDLFDWIRALRTNENPFQNEKCLKQLVHNAMECIGRVKENRFIDIEGVPKELIDRLWKEEYLNYKEPPEWKELAIITEWLNEERIGGLSTSEKTYFRFCRDVSFDKSFALILKNQFPQLWSRLLGEGIKYLKLSPTFQEEKSYWGIK